MMSTTVSRGRSVGPHLGSMNAAAPPRKHSMLKRMSSKSRTNDVNQQRPTTSNYAVISKDELVAPQATLKKSKSLRLFKSQSKDPLRRHTSSVTTIMSEDSERLDSSTAATAATAADNVLQWMEWSFPEDVMPKILSFAGPQTTSILSRTNRHWNSLVCKESTWRVMCEDLHKWKKGHPEPKSWFDFNFKPDTIVSSDLYRQYRYFVSTNSYVL